MLALPMLPPNTNRTALRPCWHNKPFKYLWHTCTSGNCGPASKQRIVKTSNWDLAVLKSRSHTNKDSWIHLCYTPAENVIHLSYISNLFLCGISYWILLLHILFGYGMMIISWVWKVDLGVWDYRGT